MYFYAYIDHFMFISIEVSIGIHLKKFVFKIDFEFLRKKKSSTISIQICFMVPFFVSKFSSNFGVKIQTFQFFKLVKQKNLDFLANFSAKIQI